MIDAKYLEDKEINLKITFRNGAVSLMIDGRTYGIPFQAFKEIGENWLTQIVKAVLEDRPIPGRL